MNGTPRRGPGGFPATPQTSRSPGLNTSNADTPTRPNVRSPLPDLPKAPPQSSSGPWIPTDVLDAASQRFYVFAFYIALWAWKLYDFYTLAVDEEDSLWLALKWFFIDTSFMFGVPLFGIPWLEWSNTASVLLSVAHTTLDFMLMLRIGVPLQSWAVALVAFMWDSELAISERNVKPGPIVHNASLILGKQIINILPEGSAVLNPYKQPFCLNSTVTQLEIPLLINQTEPIEIELLRIDIESNQNETILMKRSEVKSLLKKARKGVKHTNPTDPLIIRPIIKKPGVYVLKKVLDLSKLEVRPRASNAVVVTCPEARVKPTASNRCRHDLSDVTLEVEGVPPLRIKYHTNVGGRPREASELQSLLPDGYNSPLSRHTSQALIRTAREDVSWAQSQTVTVALNETLTHSGLWSYAVEEVSDGLGNIVNYVSLDDEDRPKPKTTVLQTLSVHERPNIKLQGCDTQHPLQTAKGNVVRLPILYGSTGRSGIDAPHNIEYLFTPEADLSPNGDHAPNAELKKQTMKTSREQPLIAASGLYTLTSVSTEFCGGEVLEPASCLLQNPLEPELSISSEDIKDKCAGNPIGFRVTLDLVGSPPFRIKYREQKAGARPASPKALEIKTLRSTIELTPPEAGHYTYTFDSISDWIYPERPLHNMVLIQDVKPSASAHFVEAAGVKQACIDDTVEFDVGLTGEGPFTLDYEIIHNGKRTKRSVDVDEHHYTIKTDKLNTGGEYAVSLISIKDKMGCKEFLKAVEAKVNVRHERPKAYFGHIDGKQAVMALEGKSVDLPLRLTGSNPWRLEYENLDTKEIKKITINDPNAKLNTQRDGIYQLLSVRDSICPGFIDEKASQFSVGWIARPKITVPESASTVFEGGKYIREAVCEGDEDAFDISLSGHPPFDVKYEQLRDRKSGKALSSRVTPVHVLAGTASIRAETTQSGIYEYKFVELADSKYDFSPKHFTPIVVQQTVNPRPKARFDKPGKTYSYCSRESDGEEVIPVTLEGVPPFYLEVEIKHHGTPKPEISQHKNIQSNKYDLKIEHRKLHLGHSAITIKKVRDARGCTFKPPPGGPRVQVSVHDAPTATALEDRTDFCVGDRLSFALGGQVPFTVFYMFEKKERKATNPGNTFRRLAELPGTFTLTGLRDSASECVASLNLTKEIHPIPSVQLSGGQVSSIDIHEGGATDLQFQFWGTPPFEFTYTRSTNAHKGRKSKVLEIRTEISHEHHLSIPVQEEGTYEVVSIKDRWCSFAKQVEGVGSGKGQKLLQY